jgi:NCS1 family nucleobase:cation symporter-1
MGVMVADYFFIRHQKIKLSHLYRPEGSDYWYTHGFNWRVIPCWIAGWAPTIGGLIVSAGGMSAAPAALFQLYYTAFFTGFSISFTTFYAVTYFFPVTDPGSFDAYDEWATFTPKEAARLGVIPNDNAEELVNTRFGASGYERQGPKVLKGQELDTEKAAPVEISEKAK